MQDFLLDETYITNEILENVPGGLAIYRVGKTFETLYYNDGVCLLSGHTREEYARVIAKDAMDIIYYEDQQMLGNELSRALNEKRKIRISYRILHKNNTPVWIHLCGQYKEDKELGLLIYAVFMDISDERKIQQLLSERADKDSLTGLFNRISFENRITIDLENNESTSAFMMIDIDNFKKINDSFGHTVGDTTLCNIAQILFQVFDKDGYVARMGGDEFAVFVKNIESISELNKKIDAFFTTIRNNQNKSIHTIQTTCSFGIALAPKHGNTFHELYANADNALLFAKNNGKNQYHYYVEGLEHPYPSLLTNMEWLLDETSNGIYISDYNTYDLLYLNQKTRDLCNVKGDEYLGKKCYKVLLGNDKPCDFCKMNQMKFGELYEREVVIEKNNMNAILKGKIFNWNGIKAHVEFVIDNTQRALIHQKLKDTAAHLQNLMDSIPGGIGIFEVDGDNIQVPYLNEGFFALIHCEVTEKNQYLGDFNYNIIHIDDLKGFYKELYRAVNENTTMNYTFRIRPKNQACVWLNMQANIAKSVGSKTTLYCSFSNVTVLKDNELEAKLQKDKFDIALENTDICVWEYNIKEKKAIQTKNSMLIYPFGEVIYDVPESLIEKGYVSPESIEDYRDIYRQLEQGNAEHSVEIHWLGFGRNNDWWAKLSHTIIYDNAHNPILAMGTTSDITNEKIAIKHYNEELENRKLLSSTTVVTFQLNLSQNDIEDCLINDQKLSKLAEYTQASALFESIQASLVGEEDRLHAKILNVEYLLDQYNQQHTHLECDYRRNLGEGYIRYLHVTINMIKHPETSDVIAFIYTNDLTESKITESAIRNFVKFYYDYIMFIDGSRAKYKIYNRQKSATYGGIDEGIYEEYFEKYLNNCISDEEKSRVLKDITIPRIYQELETKDTYEVTFMAYENKVAIKKELRFSYIEKDSKMILLAQYNMNRRND
ncbi:MAG: sensor domain-containing diguanylate cyclase [Longicatena sp.]